MPELCDSDSDDYDDDEDTEDSCGGTLSLVMGIPPRYQWQELRAAISAPQKDVIPPNVPEQAEDKKEAAGNWSGHYPGGG